MPHISVSKGFTFEEQRFKRVWFELRERMNRRTVLWVAALLLLLVLNYRRDVSRVIKFYQWEQVSNKTLHRTVSSPGVLEANQISEIKSEVDESVIKKFVQEGQTVTEGQPLLQLSNTKTQLDYDQQKNVFNNTNLDYQKAVRELEIQQKLFRSKAVSRAQVEEARQTKLKSKAIRDLAGRDLDLAKKRLDSTLVKSPLNGVVLLDATVLGANVSPGKDLIVVGDTSKFMARTKVDELDIRQIQIGQSAEIFADAYPDQTLKGVVRTIATQAERETFAKIQVLVDITDGAGLALKHNLSVRVNILTEDIPHSLGVPIKSILKKEGDMAWVVTRNWFNWVRIKKIILGKTAGKEVQVLNGISKGDRVGVPLPLGALP